MKTFEIEFLTSEGAPRRFEVRFGMIAARALHQRFKQPLRELFIHSVLGADDRGRVLRAWDPEVQLAALAAGISGGGTPVVEERVAPWVDAHIAAGGDVMTLVLPLVKAAFYSGIVTGRSQDLDAAAEQEEGQGAGKAAAPAAIPAGS